MPSGLMIWARTGAVNPQPTSARIRNNLTSRMHNPPGDHDSSRFLPPAPKIAGREDENLSCKLRAVDRPRAFAKVGATKKRRDVRCGLAQPRACLPWAL